MTFNKNFDILSVLNYPYSRYAFTQSLIKARYFMTL